MNKGDDALRSIIMKVIRRQLSLESEVLALRSILNRKGIVTDDEIAELQAAEARLEGELRVLSKRSQAEVLEELLRRFQGPKQ
jgi:hypothetical protein